MSKLLRLHLVVVFAFLSLSNSLRADLILVGHEISPAGREREIARNERFYERMDALRDQNPGRFDRAHPFYGRLLSDAAFFNKYFDRWQSHPARFEHYHPCAW